MEGRAATRRWKNVPLARERDHRRVRRLFMVLLWFAAASVPAAAYMLQQMEYVRLRYRIQDLRQRQQTLAESERLLRLERATLRAPQRLEPRAARSLGLVHPSAGNVVVVDRGRAKEKARGEPF